MAKEEVCACCGKPIEWDRPVIAVRYGRINRKVNHTSVSKERVDYFHPSCDVAIARDFQFKHLWKTGDILGNVVGCSNRTRGTIPRRMEDR